MSIKALLPISPVVIGEMAPYVVPKVISKRDVLYNIYVVPKGI